MNTTPTTTGPVEHVPVLVVGAGPAGLTTAISLARQGVQVLVVERHPGTSIFPRATALSTRSMEVLRSWELEDGVRTGSMDIRPSMSISGALTDPRHAVVSMGYPTDDAALAVSPTTPCWCPQDHLEPVLADHLIACGGDLRFDTEVVAFAQDEEAVDVGLRDTATGREHVVRASFVVAADGARSPIRTRLGIAMEGPGNLGDYVSALFRADMSTLIGDRTYALYRIERPDAGGVFLPTSRTDRWVYGQEWHPERGDSVEDFTIARCVDLIRAAAGAPDLEPEIIAVQSFEFAAQIASSYREGRVFLVGDAAHRMTPVGGMGLNTAIGDGHNLGWKLAWVLNRWAGDTLLDTYATERRPVGLHNTLRSMGTTDRSTADGLAEDLGIRYRSTAVIESGCSSQNPMSTGDPAAGAPGVRAPHVWLGVDGRRMSTLDLVDGRFTLLKGRAAPASALCDHPMVTLTCNHDFTDLDGNFHQKYGIEPDGAVLVRPDGHIAWRARSAGSYTHAEHSSTSTACPARWVAHGDLGALSLEIEAQRAQKLERERSRRAASGSGGDLLLQELFTIDSIEQIGPVVPTSNPSRRSTIRSSLSRPFQSSLASLSSSDSEATTLKSRSSCTSTWLPSSRVTSTS